MNPARSRERKCSTCKHYQPSPLWRKGWCRNPLLYDRNTNHLVEADTLACNRTFIDYWEPMTGPAQTAGPQARSTKPRIAPSIPVETMDARGRRVTVTGNTPAGGMAAVSQRAAQRAAKRAAAEQAVEPLSEPNGTERPALSLLPPTLPTDELDDMNATLELDEVARPDDQVAVGAAERIKRARTASQRVVLGQPLNRVLMMGAALVAVLAIVGIYAATRGNLFGTQPAVPTPTVAAVLATPTGFGDPTATVPPQPTPPPPTPLPTDRLIAGGWAQVSGTGSALIVRSEPSRQGARLARLADGSRVHVVEGPQEAGGISWWRVDTFDAADPAKSGWCSGDFLTPIPPP
jgi:hypothetical protein